MKYTVLFHLGIQLADAARGLSRELLMKILLVSGIYRPDIGGPATYLPHLAEYLISEGHSVVVVTLKSASNQSISEKWPVVHINRNQLLPLRFIKTFFVLLYHAKQSDRLFANGLYQECGLVLRIVKLPSVAKVVGDPVYERMINRHKVNIGRIDFQKSELKISQKLQRAFLEFSLNSFDNLTCPSLELFTIIKSWKVKRPIFVIPNGVHGIVRKNRHQKYDVVSVSRLIPLKNIDLLIKACSLKQFKLAIVGDGPEAKKLQVLAKTIGADVKFFGPLQENQVTRVLEESKIFALISEYEGLSYALLHAMALGLPPIVSATRGNLDVIKHGIDGLVVETNDIENITQAITKLVASRELRQKIGSAAKLKTEKYYTLKIQNKKILKLLELEQ